MPAVLDDPTAPAIYRTSGGNPYGTSYIPLPPDIGPRQVTLRDRITAATLIPFSSPEQVPLSLMSYLCDQLNREIEKGDTYPMISPLELSAFGPYWFASFGAVMVLGDVWSVDQLHQLAQENVDWEKRCLGSFYIKPNYPGRSSHVCNGGFLVTDGARNRGVGRLMGEVYIDWAPKLGYTYSVFNLVYETNVASCRIWDALGFKRIGRVKGCGNLRSYPDTLVDAVIYGRDLGPEGEDYVSEERFDKIRFYLKHGKYPDGADRAQKSRLRSAATHYKLIPSNGDEPEKLMLKGKEVIADPQRQYEIARKIHLQHHGGINKTTASIAEKYHWVRIKETVNLVIRNCQDCKDIPAKASNWRNEGTNLRQTDMNSSQAATNMSGHVVKMTLEEPSAPKLLPSEEVNAAEATPVTQALPLDTHMSQATEPDQHLSLNDVQSFDYNMPVDPQIMNDIQQHFSEFGDTTAQQDIAHFSQPLSPRQFASPPLPLTGAFTNTDPSQTAPGFEHSQEHSFLMHQTFSPDGHQPFQGDGQGLGTQGSGQDEDVGGETSAAVQAAQQAMLNELDGGRDVEINQQLINAAFGSEQV